MTPTPVRHIRILDDDWGPAMRAAEVQGETVPDIVRLALRAYAVDPAGTVAALAAIRGGVR
jgi:hypothetical protein